MNSTFLLFGFKLVMYFHSRAVQCVFQGSFELPEYTSNVNSLGTLRLLDAIRTCNMEKKVKFFQASTSEMFGKVQEVPQRETTPLYPRSPYGKINTLGSSVVYICYTIQ